MKNLISNTEGVWFEPIFIIPTTEEDRLLQSTDDNDSLSKAALGETNRLRRENPASTEDSTIAQNIYEFHKPVLKETDTYVLIGIDLRIDGISTNGMINCRVNGDHKQIRF
jgi:hypothetical protein